MIEIIWKCNILNLFEYKLKNDIICKVIIRQE